MKKFLILFAMVAFVGTMASAQSTAKKTCTKAKKATQTKMVVAEKQDLPSCPVKAAAKLAAADANIQSKTCAASGKVTYYQKSVCPSSGKVSMKEVKYDSRAQKFVNVAPVKLDAKAKTTQLKAKKKSCCSKKGKKKACSKKKSAQLN